MGAPQVHKEVWRSVQAPSSMGYRLETCDAEPLSTPGHRSQSLTALSVRRKKKATHLVSDLFIILSTKVYQILLHQTLREF